MDDRTSSRQFEADDEYAEADSVRILPDAVRSGSLYAPAPEPPYPTGRAQLPPYDPTPIGAQLPTAGDAGEKPARRSSPSACLVLAVTFSLLAVSCLALAFATFRGGLDGLGKLSGIIPSLGINLVTTPTVTIDTSRPAVIEQVHALSKLETVHYQLEKIITAKSSGPLFDFLTSDKILLVAHGEVVAGVDLNKVRSEDIEVVSGSVTITLPQSEILSSKLDNEKTYVYDRQTGLLNKPDPNLESQMRVVAEQQIVQAAKEDGILDKASANAEQTLRTLLTGLGYTDIQFKEGR